MAEIEDAFTLAAKSVVDGINAAETDAKAYTDAQLAALPPGEGGDPAVLAAAKAYTDQQIAALEELAIDEAELDAKLQAAFNQFRAAIELHLLHDATVP